MRISENSVEAKYDSKLHYSLAQAAHKLNYHKTYFSKTVSNRLGLTKYRDDSSVFFDKHKVDELIAQRKSNPMSKSKKKMPSVKPRLSVIVPSLKPSLSLTLAVSPDDIISLLRKNVKVHLEMKS